MKTLYVSDLDGTLLTPEKEISKASADILNHLIRKGLLFTVATARSPGYRLRGSLQFKAGASGHPVKWGGALRLQEEAVRRQRADVL